jgi:hypothetical protein
MVRASRQAIGDALDWEVRNAQERLIDALNGVVYPKIQNQSEFYKGIVLVGILSDISTFFFPAAAVAKAYKKIGAEAYEVSKFIFTVAQSKFNKEVDAISNNHNAILALKYTSVKAKFLNLVMSQGRVFIATPYATNVISQIDQFLKAYEFGNERVVKAFCRELIHNLGFLETDLSVLKKQADKMLKPLLKNVMAIYLATYHRPWTQGDILFNYSWGTPPWPTTTMGIMNKMPPGWKGTRFSKDEKKIHDQILAKSQMMEIRVIKSLVGRSSVTEAFVRKRPTAGSAKSVAPKLANQVRMDPSLLQHAAKKTLDTLKSQGITDIRH